MRRRWTSGSRRAGVLCARFLRDRTKMLHVKHFGTIDHLRKRTIARRGEVRSWDLEQTEECGTIYVLVSRFFKKFLPAVKHAMARRRLRKAL
jgi:hypothetical protein